MCAVEPPAFERAPVAIEGNGKFESVFRCRSLHAVYVPITRRLGMEDANYLKALTAVFALKLTQSGSSGGTQVAGIGPPADEHDLIAQITDFQGGGVDPLLQFELRSSHANSVLAIWSIGFGNPQSDKEQEGKS